MGGMYDYEILRQLAASRGGISLTMEHRYYGDSRPLNHLLRERYGCPHCPVYPSIVDMALAASAPVFLDSPGFGNELDYYAIVTNATRRVSPRCPDAVRAAIAAVVAADSATLTQELGVSHRHG
eukprot:gene34920-44032_t